jgi:hypothetical protein
MGNLSGADGLTIYEALKAKLGREPTYADIKADVQRIIDEARFGRVERLAKQINRRGP